MQREGTWLRSLLIALGLMALFLALPLCASAADADWDGQTNQGASTLGGTGVSYGDTITITGNGSAGGATLTIDVDGITVTSSGPVSNVGIAVASNVTTLTIKDLDLTAAEEKGVGFSGHCVLTVEGVCRISGGDSASNYRNSAIDSLGNLTLEVGDATLEAIGGAYTGPNVNNGGAGLYCLGTLTVTVNTGSLSVRGGSSSNSRGGSGLYGDFSIDVTNVGGIITIRGGAGTSVGTGISGNGDVTLTGPGPITAEGWRGISVQGTLTVNGPVEAKGDSDGINFYGSNGKITGAGTLVVTAGGSGAANAGIYTQRPLELAFTGDLDVRSASHGIYFAYNDTLTVSATPTALYIQPGGSGYAIGDCGGLTNISAIPDSVLVLGGTRSIRWPVITPTTSPTPPPVAATYYTVIFDSRGGSAVAAQTVKRGSRVEAPAAPERAGHTFTGWHTNPECTEKYDFTNPLTRELTLYAGWAENEPGAQVNAPYLAGYPDGTFKPGGTITRAEAAVMLYTLANGEMLVPQAVAVSAESFKDVAAGIWYYDAVTELARAGVFSGYPNGSFKPEGRITRTEFMIMIVRYLGLEATGQASFADVPASFWGAGYIAAAEAAGLVSGYPNGNFGPDDKMTRAQAVTVLNRMLGRRVDTKLFDGLKMPFSDVAENHWAYWQIMAAAVAHEATE